MTDFGDYLRQLREAKKFTVRQLATYSKVSHGYISQVENGTRNRPTPKIIEKLAPVLGITYEEMMKKAGYFHHDQESNNLKMFTERLKYLLDKLDLTLEQFAQQVGLNTKTVSSWFEGLNKLPGQQTLNKCAEVLGVTRDYLLGYTDDPQGYGNHSYPTDKPDLKKLLETQPLRYDGVELDPDEQELINQHVRMAYDLIKKSNKIRAEKRKKNTPSEE